MPEGLEEETCLARIARPGKLASAGFGKTPRKVVLNAQLYGAWKVQSRRLYNALDCPVSGAINRIREGADRITSWPILR